MRKNTRRGQESNAPAIALAVVLALYTLAGTLDYQYAVEATEPQAMCETDSECEGVDAPIETYADWVDAGCTEESRLNDYEFDRLCRAFELAHPELDFTHN